jgi:hypothetical protein
LGAGRTAVPDGVDLHSLLDALDAALTSPHTVGEGGKDAT